MNRKTPATGGRSDLYSDTSEDRIPIWISTPNYYFIVLFIAAALFLAVWATLYDGFDDTPWIVAAIAAAGFAVSLIFFREVVLRKSRGRALAARRLSRQLQSATKVKPNEDVESKITLKRNEELLREIQAKSDAAKVLGKFAEAHKEVFDLCERYLQIAMAELDKARPGSPRIAALRKGSILASRRHRFHMLKWAEIKARSIGDASTNGANLSEKMAAATEALTAVDRAIESYPDESALVESRAVLNVFLESAQIKRSIEKAEHAEAEGAGKEAIKHYRQALAGLQQYGVEIADREAMRTRIQAEIDRISDSCQYRPL